MIFGPALCLVVNLVGIALLALGGGTAWPSNVIALAWLTVGAMTIGALGAIVVGAPVAFLLLRSGRKGLAPFLVCGAVIGCALALIFWTSMAEESAAGVVAVAVAAYGFAYAGLTWLALRCIARSPRLASLV
ncbi:MAG: hypothetical protein IT548_13290 [Alphaproteobacteria bacterium]|nr:hypothetical protein [Alphaproteobacteria bacterium]